MPASVNPLDKVTVSVNNDSIEASRPLCRTVILKLFGASQGVHVLQRSGDQMQAPKEARRVD